MKKPTKIPPLGGSESCTGSMVLVCASMSDTPFIFDPAFGLARDNNILVNNNQILNNQITQTKHQISKIDMCMASEDLRIGKHIDILNDHLGGFQKLFDRDQREIEQRLKEQRDKEAKLQEDLRQKEKQIVEQNQRQMREVAAIEEECEVIERGCAVLRKRNSAIMLKLKKRLLEAEIKRREVIKRKCSADEQQQ